MANHPLFLVASHVLQMHLRLVGIYLCNSVADIGYLQKGPPDPMFWQFFDENEISSVKPILTDN